jgi:hypothetical protein
VHCPVRFHVMLGGVFGMLGGVDVMAVSQMGVVSGRFVVSLQMALGGFAVVTRSVLVMLRCLSVMMGCFVGHRKIPLIVPVASRHLRIIRTGDWRLGYSTANSP